MAGAGSETPNVAPISYPLVPGRTYTQAMLFDQVSGFEQLAGATKPGGDLSREELKQVASNVWKFYEEGTPFFPKETLRRIGQQLAQAEKDRATHIIPVKGIDGVTVEFKVKLADTELVTEEQDPQFIAHSACLKYQTPEKLASDRDMPTVAYCSLRIMHQMVSTHKIPASVAKPAAIEEVGKALNNARQAWEASEQCKQTRDILTSSINPAKISNIVGFALGCFDPEEISDRAASRSGWQHALLLTLKDFLVKPGEQEQTPCYAQDPVYTAAEKAVLQESGVTVLEDPNGFAEVDDDSVVLSFAPNCPVKSIVFDSAKPALMICDTVEREEPKDEPKIGDRIPGSHMRWGGRTDPDTPRVKQAIFTHYDEFVFIEDKEHFGKMSMYIKRQTLPS